MFPSKRRGSSQTPALHALPARLNVLACMSDAPTLPPLLSSLGGESLDSSLLRVLMDTIPDRIYFKDLHSRFVRNNAAHARSLGAASPAACVGKSDFDFFSAEHAQHARDDEENIIRTGRPVIGKEERLVMRDGSRRWASSTKMPWRDASGAIIGTFGLSRDITATKEAEEKLTEERNLLRTIIDHLPSRLYVKDTASRYVLNNQAHLAMLGVGSQAEAIGKTTADFFPGERGLQALADDRQVLYGGDPIIGQEKSDFGAEDTVHWSLVTKVPLHDVSGQLAGLVGISHDITARKLAEEELQRRNDEMETDLLMARQVQEAFLNRAYPHFPSHATAAESALRFAHRYVPATTLGGDFYDLLQLSDTRCGVLMCDVMGHGVRAGLLTTLIRGVVEEMGSRAGDPGHVLGEINRSLAPIVEQTGQPVFATVFYGVIDLSARTLAYANAGHPPPLVRPAGATATLQLAAADPEPAAGLIADFTYHTITCAFGPGDLLFTSTDGLLEAAAPSGEQYGEARLRAFFTTHAKLGADQLLAPLLAEIAAFTGRAHFEDDLCALVVERAP
ncbi:MAG: SpoIIE family protein phosphatase [Opitutaceae bacterium]|nr:SpoIIE family protein phosphatase [Opitutaceae bacterium]